MTDNLQPTAYRLPPTAYRRDLLVLFPGALGDFVCFLPTLRALVAGAGEVTLVTRQPYLALVADPRIRCLSIDRREIAALFSLEPPGSDARRLLGGHRHVESWTGAGTPAVRDHLSAINASVRIHPFRAMRPGEHAVDYYARCAGVEPIDLHDDCENDPLLDAAVTAATRWAVEQLRRVDNDRPILALHPGSGSPRKCWTGMTDLAAWWREEMGGRLVLLLGPAEHVSPAHDLKLEHLPLPRLAAILRHVDLYIGNDSGVSHLAASAGARGLALFGPTSNPTHWRPRSREIETIHAATPCRSCGENVFCTHTLPLQHVQHLLASRSPIPLAP